MAFSIVPGVVLPGYRQMAAIGPEVETMAAAEAPLPMAGGVGQVPVPIIHQGHLPICTGVAAANARMILQYLQQRQRIHLSGLFIYKMNRVFDGLPLELPGSTLEASMQTLYYKGVCQERLYPTNVQNCRRPFPADGARLVAQARPYRISRYVRCQSLPDILLALSRQYPVAFSMVIYTDFYQARAGLVAAERCGQRIGGHAMVAVNYDHQRQLVQVLQSWGREKQGPTDGGYMYIPYSWFSMMDTIASRPLLIEAFALVE